MGLMGKRPGRRGRGCNAMRQIKDSMYFAGNGRTEQAEEVRKRHVRVCPTKAKAYSSFPLESLRSS
jgi:hypothetical protein